MAMNSCYIRCMLTSYNRTSSRFKFSNHFSSNLERWEEFDRFMNELAENNSEEFSRSLYSNNRFIILLMSGGHCFDAGVPESIQKQISGKLRELFFGK